MIRTGARLVLAVSIVALSGGLASAQPAPSAPGFVQVAEEVLFYRRYGTGTASCRSSRSSPRTASTWPT